MLVFTLSMRVKTAFDSFLYTYQIAYFMGYLKYKIMYLFFFFFFFFFFFCHICSIWEFPGQGSNPSCSCVLCHSCGNTRSLAHHARLGIEPMPLQRQGWILNLLIHILCVCFKMKQLGILRIS